VLGSKTSVYQKFTVAFAGENNAIGQRLTKLQQKQAVATAAVRSVPTKVRPPKHSVLTTANLNRIKHNFWATVYKTVRPMLSHRSPVLSVYL